MPKLCMNSMIRRGEPMQRNFMASTMARYAAVFFLLTTIGVALVFSVDARFLGTAYSKTSSSKDRLAVISIVLDRYREDFGGYPKSLKALVVPSSNGRYFSVEKPFNDAWGRPMVYKSGPPLLLYSLGANGVDDHGEGDDIAAE